MGNSVVRNLIGLLILIVLSFTIGIMAADSMKSAAIIIVAIVGLVGIVAMGKNVWMLLFLLIPFGEAFPLVQVKAYFFYVIPIFAYWCILAILGRAHFTWRKLPGADFIFFLFLAYMATIIYRFPALDQVTCGILGIKSTYYNLRYEYHLCVFVLIFYLAFSCIPFEKKHLFSVIKWGVIIKLVLLFFAACLGVDQNMAETKENLSNTLMHGSRLGMFSTFAINLFVFAYASAPFQKLIQSPKAIAAILISICLILISGFRNRLGRLGLTLIGIAVIKREYLGFIVALCLGLFSLSLINSRDTLNQLPYTVQRVLGIIPWMDVNPSIRKDGENSSDWRFVMWRWALDPRAGYIKNYVWGDGCLFNVAEYERNSRARRRKEITVGTQEVAASMRVWHGGFVATLQELGIVGLGIVMIAHLYVLFTTIRIGSALRKSPYLKYFLVYTYSFLQTYITYYILPASTYSFLIDLANFSYLKLFHWIAVEEGLIKPGRRGVKYTPLLIQEDNHPENKPMPVHS